MSIVATRFPYWYTGAYTRHHVVYALDGLRVDPNSSSNYSVAHAFAGVRC